MQKIFLTLVAVLTFIIPNISEAADIPDFSSLDPDSISLADSEIVDGFSEFAYTCNPTKAEDLVQKYVDYISKNCPFKLSDKYVIDEGEGTFYGFNFLYTGKKKVKFQYNIENNKKYNLNIERYTGSSKFDVIVISFVDGLTYEGNQ